MRKNQMWLTTLTYHQDIKGDYATLLADIVDVEEETMSTLVVREELRHVVTLAMYGSALTVLLKE